MNKVRRPTKEEALADSLAGVIGYLRARQYEGVRDELWKILLHASDRFVNNLAEHLKDEEAQIFPALCSVAPEFGTQLEALKSEHAGLADGARDLAMRIGEGDSTQALETARGLLTQLMEHMRREDGVITAILKSRNASALRRLAKLLPSSRGGAPVPSKPRHAAHGGKR
ncbi:MAG: hemerythrin domain-containing protein [Planctomycetes bacterium]|nr:hemerythrin domain-containing protein [Planctomycetota bacterium]